MNVALHGMEKAAGVHYVESGYNAGTTRKWAPVLIRYADDFLVLCHTRERAEEVKEKLAGWLVTRGLAFNEGKARIVHLNDGCDFLGFNIRRYSGKLLIKPSTAAMRRIRDRLTAEVRSLRGSNAAAVIRRLNPHHPRMGRLLPDRGVQLCIQGAGLSHVASHVQLGAA
ncbi:reverse transcriptase domain-containing protein [Streptomyces sp. NPDC006333]|uniref:reverse transcriptase domain-containing protein n=1 Tax=Streptomyces sp. NPDC006333 TaxID=3156753 RepID=UPI0033AF98B2